MSYGLIYLAQNIQNKKVYIGKTNRKFEKRKNEHLTHSLNETEEDYNVYFHTAIRKYGWHNFKWQILGYCSSKEELKTSEIECIYFYRSYGVDGKHYDRIYGYNMTIGGDGGIGGPHFKGYKQTEEAKEKIRIANTGENNHKFGKQNSEETRQKIKDNAKTNPNYGMKGKKHTEEVKQKMRVPKKCKDNYRGQLKPPSEETKKKISISNERKDIDSNIIIYLYTEKNIKINHIAQRLGCSFSLVKRRLIKYKII